MTRRDYYWFCFLALLPLAIGCAPATMGTPAPPDESVESTQPENAGTPSEPQSLTAAETWDAVILGGARIGSIHTVREKVADSDPPLWKTTSVTRLETKRFGETAVQETRVTSIENELGELVRFESESALGAAPLKANGEVANESLQMTTTIGGKKQTAKQPWEKNNLGFDGVNKSLLRQPLQPGEERKLKVLTPGLDKPLLATIELAAGEWKKVSFGNGKRQLLEVKAKQVLPGGQSMPLTLWLDDRGDILKTELMPGMTAERTTREAATSALVGGAAPRVDLGLDTMPTLRGVRGDLHRAGRVTYLVKLADGEPATLFANSGFQQVSAAADPHTARITVWASDSNDPSLKSDVTPPSDAETLPNQLVQSDDTRIERLAAEAISDATTDAEKARRLEQFVHGYIEQASFSQAFATASEVAESRRGDCTEYAVLLAALARAAKIPSRVAVGLVYTHTAGEPGLAFHMWDELFVDGAWRPFDATLAMGGIGGGHLKLSHSSLTDGTALASFLPVIQVMGRLDIEAVEVAKR